MYTQNTNNRVSQEDTETFLDKQRGFFAKLNYMTKRFYIPQTDCKIQKTIFFLFKPGKFGTKIFVNAAHVILKAQETQFNRLFEITSFNNIPRYFCAKFNEYLHYNKFYCKPRYILFFLSTLRYLVNLKCTCV